MISKILRGVTVAALLVFSVSLIACGSSSSKGRSSLTQSSDDRLSDIVLTGATLDTSFSSDTLTYDAELSDNTLPTVTVAIEKKQSGQSVTIDGITAETASLTVSGTSQTCAIKVTSEDGTNSRTYTIAVRQKTNPDTNAYLGSLSITGISFAEAFSKTSYSYSAVVSSSAVSAVINFAAASSTAAVYFNDTVTTDSNKTVSLSTGSNKFVIRVVSEDKSAANEYAVTIVRSSTYDTSLSSLVISSGTLSPAFSSTTLEYTAKTSSSSFTVTPTATDNTAVITVNGSAVTSGSTSQSISFTTSGEVKNAAIAVSLGGVTTTYTVAMTYDPEIIEGNAYLSALATSAGTLSFGKQTFAYTGYSVESTVESVTVTPTAEDSSASITVNGTAAVSGTASTVALTSGEDNIIDITVTDGTKTHTYLVAVTRKGEGSAITGVWVNAYVPASWNWSGVYIHYWTASQTYTTWASCPAMTSAGSGWYSFHITEADPVNALIKDATGTPTATVNKSSDQTNLTGDVYISCPASTWVNTTTRPDGAPSHQGWSAPAKPVITFSPDGGDIVSGESVTITAAANSTGATISTSGYLVDGVKVSGLSAFALTKNANIVAFAKNSIGGASVSESKSFTVTSATKPKITMSPTSGSFTTTQTVAVTTTNTTTRYYSIDGGAWTAFTDASLIIGASTATGSSITLQIKAVNSATSEETLSAVCSYTKTAVYTETFSWDNVNAYFVLTDRFYNGDTSNDASYGRTNNYNSAGLTADINTATFHGGDIKGLTAKLNANYFKDLGTNAIWITAPYEQAHGFVGGGWNNGAATYPHYGYHGYYTLDWTEMDKNMGTVEEFRTFVKTAHSQGIRVIMDIVMNHTGYENIADAAEYGYGGISLSVSAARGWSPSDGNWGGFSTLYAAAGDSSWNKWFGSSWVRAGKYNTSTGGSGSGETDDVSFLPDVKNQKTETSNVGLPPVLVTKWAAEGTANANWVVPAASSLRTDLGVCPAIYQEKWLAAWVEEFGIDGFRVDTAKHVSVERWAELKALCQSALTTWRASAKSSGDAAQTWSDNFWMTGEVWDRGLSNDGYYSTGKFDSLINFQFPKGKDVSSIGSTWASYANTLNNGNDGFNVLSYLNSHDARQNYGWVTTDANAGTCLLLSPGGVQTYYGDEVVRPLAGDLNYDKNQSTRSDYQWSAQNTTVLAHWQKLGTFRREHVCVGAGKQTDLGSSAYGRSYTTAAGVTDKVVIKINASGSTSVSVTGFFDNGVTVKNHYDSTTAVVSNGAVTFTASNGVILIESAN
jgi:glycosidase